MASRTIMAASLLSCADDGRRHRAKLVAVLSATERRDHPHITAACEGSGGARYLQRIDLGSLTAGCSCPDRAAVCKHTAAVLQRYLAARGGAQ